MAAKNDRAAEPADREFVIARIFSAARALVFKAWTDPRHMARWWGPRGFSCPVCTMDARPGGAYRVVMRSPEGADYPMKGVYLEVVENERLVYTSDLSEHPDEWHDLVDPNWRQGKGKPTLDITTTVTFEERDGKTLLTVRMRLPSAEIRDSMVKMGMNEGWSQSFERLTELLGKI